MADVEELKTGAIDASSALAVVLRARRQDFNERFVYARHVKPTLDPAVFKQVLSSVVAPVVEQWAGYPQLDIGEAVSVLYDIALELTGAGILGQTGKPETLDDAWLTILPVAPHLVKSDCAAFVATVTNSTYNVARVSGARRLQFVYELARLAAACPDLRTLRETGKILAWRCGLAHYREGALDACGGLGWDFAAAALGFSAVPSISLTDFLERLKSDPWLHPFSASGNIPASSLRIVRQVGAFRGYGGPFLRPPQVILSDEDFYATDGQGWWLLCADIFGSTITRCAEPDRPESMRRPAAESRGLPGGAEAILQNARGFLAGALGKPASAVVEDAGAPQADEFLVGADGTISCGRDKIMVPKSDPISSFAVGRKTLLVATKTSHKILVIARPTMLV